MAIKLYNRANPQIQGIGIVETPKSTMGTQVASGLQTYAGKIQKAAENNFALGQAQVINDITTQAYEIAPDDINKFNELVNASLNKSLNGLNTNIQEKIKNSVNVKLNSIRHKIVQNKLNRLDRENKDRVIGNGNSILNGTGGVFETNTSLVDYLYQTSNSTGDAQKRNVEFFKSFKENNNRNFKQLEALTNIKDSNGNPYLSKKDYDNYIKQSKDNLKEVLKQKIYSLDKEQLENFYNNTLQDNKAMESIGISFNDAETIRDYAKERGKEIDKEIEFQTKTQNQYNAARMVINYDDEQAKELVSKGYMTNDMRKELKKANETNFNLVTVKDTDINVISQFALLDKIANSEDDGSEDYNNKLLGIMADTTKSLNEFIKTQGSSKEVFEASTNTLFNLAVNKDIQEVIKPCYDENTLLGNALNNARKNTSFFSDEGILKHKQDVSEWELTKDFDNKLLKEVASKGLMQISLMASQLNNEGLTDEEKSAIKENIKQYRGQLNKEMIKAKYSKQFPLDYLNELEAKYNAGQEVMFMKNGITYFFKGFSDNDIMVQVVK